MARWRHSRPRTDFEVLAESGSAEELLAYVDRVQPDVALVDVEMPGMDGLAATSLLKKRHPGVRVIIVTTFGRPGFLRKALESGAEGFVVKDTPAHELADAVRRVQSGLRVVDPVLAADSLASVRRH